MRPLDKKKPGETVTLWNGDSHTIGDSYNPYGDARKALIANFGSYCSYCEIYLANAALLQTEHIKPRSKYPELANKWDNFLLACATCNGKGNKGEIDVDLDEIHLPHRNNTFKSFVYKEAGVVDINPDLSPLAREHAQKLMDLIGLGKPDSDTDFRCGVRRQTWDMAKIYLSKYEAGEYELSAMINDIKNKSCWSIWFTVFRGHDEVRKALIDEFAGTAAKCFDPANHYEPIDRNPGLSDPT